ncbi:hypothetical protein ACSBR2_000049 [Camellia fascicularis]
MVWSPYSLAWQVELLSDPLISLLWWPGSSPFLLSTSALIAATCPIEVKFTKGSKALNDVCILAEDFHAPGASSLEDTKRRLDCGIFTLCFTFVIPSLSCNSS